jgi:hypothetical protein
MAEFWPQAGLLGTPAIRPIRETDEERIGRAVGACRIRRSGGRVEVEGRSGPRAGLFVKGSTSRAGALQRRKRHVRIRSCKHYQ